jgi:glutamate decarboxylase
MEPQAEALMAECLGKNMIDKDEYPQTAELESRCVSILADLWHARGGSEATGSSTTGSSEACMLGGMALLWRWRERGGSGQPNLVMGANVQVCWFFAPFLHPGLVWDFRVPRVASINAAGHKYGLVYPGVGWVVWRDPQALPEDLVFKVNYLGGQMPTFALNFSRSGAPIAAQYYNFLRLGFDGYRRVHQACQDVALHLSSRIAGMGPFELLTDGSELPVFAFKLAGDQAGYSVFDLSDRLRTRGWLVPAYIPGEPDRHRGDADRGPQRIQP